MRSEKAELNDTLLAVSALPETLVYQNVTGMAWQGKKVEVPIGATFRMEPRMVVLRDARPIRFGLLGSGDIMGSVAGRATAIEMKSAIGRQRTDQASFETAWKKAGGIYILARSPEEALAGLRGI